MQSPQPSIDTDVVTIDPATASKWLETNNNNRPLRLYTVLEYARQMTRGLWQLNGEAIIFDENGNLIDGQHRLHAVVKSGATIQSLVIVGISREAQETIDVGMKRTVGAQLSIGNAPITSATVVASICNNLAMFALQDSGFKLTASEVRSIYERNSEAMLNAVRSAHHSRGARPGSIGAVHFIASTYLGAGVLGDQFASVFKTGVPSKPGCPAHKLREKMLAANASGRPFGKAEALSLIANAWDAFRRGRSLVLLKSRNDFKIDGFGRTEFERLLGQGPAPSSKKRTREAV